MCSRAELVLDAAGVGRHRMSVQTSHERRLHHRPWGRAFVFKIAVDELQTVLHVFVKAEPPPLLPMLSRRRSRQAPVCPGNTVAAAAAAEVFEVARPLSLE